LVLYTLGWFIVSFALWLWFVDSLALPEVWVGLAAALAATSSITGRRFVDSISMATALFVTVICALLVVQSIHAPIVYAFGGWQPQHGIVIGILFGD
jgi:hypothetical protein